MAETPDGARAWIRRQRTQRRATLAPLAVAAFIGSALVDTLVERAFPRATTDRPRWMVLAVLSV